MSAKVYVVQENPNLNYTPAERYGEVHFVTASEFSPSKNSIRNVQIISDIDAVVEKFDADSDFLLMSGNPITMGYMLHAVLAKKGYVQVLWYNRNDQSYVVVPFCPALLKQQSAIS